MSHPSPDSPIRVVLFDADGVIQRQPHNWLQTLAAFAPATADPDEFVQAIFQAEDPCLKGLQDFPNALQTVLKRYRCDTPMLTVIKHWQLIEPIPEIIETIRQIRTPQMQVGLATNQNGYRLAYMLSHLGFSDIFDHICCSCQLGQRKPTIDFFKQCLAQLNLSAEQVMFVDDSADNVAAAKSLGIDAVQYHFSEGADVLQTLLTR